MTGTYLAYAVVSVIVLMLGGKRRAGLSLAVIAAGAGLLIVHAAAHHALI